MVHYVQSGRPWNQLLGSLSTHLFTLREDTRKCQSESECTEDLLSVAVREIRHVMRKSPHVRDDVHDVAL